MIAARWVDLLHRNLILLPEPRDFIPAAEAGLCSPTKLRLEESPLTLAERARLFWNWLECRLPRRRSSFAGATPTTYPTDEDLWDLRPPAPLPVHPPYCRFGDIQETRARFRRMLWSRT